MAKTKDKVSGAADNVKPFVERALHDEKLRDDVQSAFAVARKVYEELAGSKDVSKAASKVAGDKKLHRDMQSAIEDLRDAALRLQGKEKRKRGGGKKLPVTGPETRRFIKDLVTGGGDEFSGDFGSSDGGS
jgi:hypothetical protein